jgi:hypothetical protein
MVLLKKYTQFLRPHQVKRRKYLIIISLLFFYAELRATEINGLGTKAIAMANAFVALSDNCWGIYYNPAGLKTMHDVQCSAFIVPAQFGLQELATRALAVTIPFSLGAVGVGVSKFGYDLYSETAVELAFARRLDEKIAAGLGVEYNRTDIARYGTAGCMLMHIGLLVQVSDNIWSGFCAHNVTAAVLGTTREKLPQVCTLGICWSPFAGFYLPLEIEKDIHFPASIKLGFEQHLLSVIALRAGIANNPDKFCMGCSVRWSGFEFGYAGYSHPDLGWTHQIDVTLSWGD